MLISDGTKKTIHKVNSTVSAFTDLLWFMFIVFIGEYVYITSNVVDSLENIFVVVYVADVLPGVGIMGSDKYSHPTYSVGCNNLSLPLWHNIPDIYQRQSSTRCLW